MGIIITRNDRALAFAVFGDSAEGIIAARMSEPKRYVIAVMFIQQCIDEGLGLPQITAALNTVLEMYDSEGADLEVEIDQERPGQGQSVH